VSVVTHHRRSNSRTIATAKCTHRINSAGVFGFIRARLSELTMHLENFLTDCRPWLGKVSLTMGSFRCPPAIAEGPVRNENEEGRLFPCLSVLPGRRTRRRPGARDTYPGMFWRVASPQTSKHTGPGTALALSSTPTRVQHITTLRCVRSFFGASETQMPTHGRGGPGCSDSFPGLLSGTLRG
jgi:hypothetical protein